MHAIDANGDRRSLGRIMTVDHEVALQPGSPRELGLIDVTIFPIYTLKSAQTAA